MCVNVRLQRVSAFPFYLPACGVRWVVNWNIVVTHTEPRSPVHSQDFVFFFLTVQEGKFRVETDLYLPQDLYILSKEDKQIAFNNQPEHQPTSE